MRKAMEHLWALFSRLSVFALLVSMGIFIGYLFWRGSSAMSLSLFFGGTRFLDAITGHKAVWGGIWPACVGTFCLVVLSSVMAIPVGVASGIYLSGYAGRSLKRYLNLMVGLLAGIPSIVMGLFGFMLILLLRKTILPSANTSLLLSAFCIAMLILPYLIETTQATLDAIPLSLKLVGPSLGLSKGQNIFHVLLPAGASGILSGIILAIGRAAEDTAVIMLTGVVANAGIPGGLTEKFEALPFKIFYLAAEYRTPRGLNEGFAAALVLLCLTGTLFMVAYLLRRRIGQLWGAR